MMFALRGIFINVEEDIAKTFALAPSILEDTLSH